MIARLRGEHHNHPGGWRPTLDPQRDPLERPGDRSEGARRPGLRRAFREPAYALVWRSRGARWLALLAVAVVGLIIAGWSLSRRAPVRTEPRLPATPRAWLDAYEAAAIDNPPLVCSRLFSPALAASYGRVAHGSCTTYFERISSSSVTVGRILRDGGTAVLELRQALDHTDWAVVLNRHTDGWQAVDLLDGRLLR